MPGILYLYSGEAYREKGEALEELFAVPFAWRSQQGISLDIQEEILLLEGYAEFPSSLFPYAHKCVWYVEVPPKTYPEKLLALASTQPFDHPLPLYLLPWGFDAKQWIQPARSFVEKPSVATCFSCESRSREERKQCYAEAEIIVTDSPLYACEAIASSCIVFAVQGSSLAKSMREGVEMVYATEKMEGEIQLLWHSKERLQSLRKHSLRWMQKRHWRSLREAYALLAHTLLAETHRFPFFRGKKSLYLGSADCMQTVEQHGCALPYHEIDQFVSVIGGLSGLHLLPHLKVKELLFFDVNVYALHFLQLIRELLIASPSRCDFMTAFFGRRFEESLLTTATQQHYLAQPFEAEQWQARAERLSEGAKEIYTKVLKPCVKGEESPSDHCQRLLPCWPRGEKLPVTVGEKRGRDQWGRWQPNTNTLHFGQGWLQSESTYQHVRRLFCQTPFRCLVFDVAHQAWNALVDYRKRSLLYLSNISPFFHETYSCRRKEWRQGVAQEGGQSLLITQEGMENANDDPHYSACEALRPYLLGDTIEVVHKRPWGFTEFERETLLVEEYLQRPYAMGTLLLHTLVSEGVSRAQFEKIWEKAQHEAQRVLLLEHEKGSSEWPVDKAKCFFSFEEVSSFLRGKKGRLLHASSLPGPTGEKRNFLFVIDFDSSNPGFDTPWSAENPLSAKS